MASLDPPPVSAASAQADVSIFFGLVFGFFMAVRRRGGGNATAPQVDVANRVCMPRPPTHPPTNSSPQVPLAIMFFRLLTRSRHEGASAMFSPPLTSPTKHTLSSRTRHFLFVQTQYGFMMDIGQAACSAVSCILYIVVSYILSEPTWVTDVEVRNGVGGGEGGDPSRARQSPLTTPSPPLV